MKQLLWILSLVLLTANIYAERPVPAPCMSPYKKWKAAEKALNQRLDAFQHISPDIIKRKLAPFQGVIDAARQNYEDCRITYQKQLNAQILVD